MTVEESSHGWDSHIIEFSAIGTSILPIHDPQFDEALGRIIYRNEQPRTAH